MSASVELDTARESILRQQVSATQKAQLFVDKAQELRLDRRQWQVLVWSLPYDIIEAIGFLTWQRGVWPGSMAQPEVCFSTQDLQLIRQCVVAAFSEHPYFKELTNRHIPEGTATKSELAQASKYAQSGSIAQPGARLSTQDLQFFQQCVAKALSERPHFKELMNRHISERTVTKSELAQASKDAKSDTDSMLCIPAPALPHLM